MGKGDRRNRKMLPRGLPELAPVQGRSHARDRRGTNAPRGEDARVVALTARCHHLGTVPDRDGRRAASAPHLGHDLGRVMERLAPDDVARLWSVWSRWDAAERAYRMTVIGITESPQNAALPILPERIEADPDHRPDTRDADERHRDTVNRWMDWQGYLGSLPTSADASRLHQARRGNGPALWREHEPTDAGAATLRVLMALADVVEKFAAKRL